MPEPFQALPASPGNPGKVGGLPPLPHTPRQTRQPAENRHFLSLAGGLPPRPCRNSRQPAENLGLPPLPPKGGGYSVGASAALCGRDARA